MLSAKRIGNDFDRRLLWFRFAIQTRKDRLEIETIAFDKIGVGKITGRFRNLLRMFR